MIKSKLALVVAAAAIAFASPAFAKTLRHSQNDPTGQQIYNSATVPPGAQLDNPYYAPYSGQPHDNGGFVLGGFH
jgi:hypothetical protein